MEDVKESGAGFILKVMRMWHFHDKNLKESIQKMFNSYHNECLRLGISENEPISGLTAQNEVEAFAKIQKEWISDVECRGEEENREGVEEENEEEANLKEEEQEHSEREGKDDEETYKEEDKKQKKCPVCGKNY